jgi:hypothetical protein
MNKSNHHVPVGKPEMFVRVRTLIFIYNIVGSHRERVIDQAPEERSMFIIGCDFVEILRGVGSARSNEFPRSPFPFALKGRGIGQEPTANMEPMKR